MHLHGTTLQWRKKYKTNCEYGVAIHYFIIPINKLERFRKLGIGFLYSAIEKMLFNLLGNKNISLLSSENTFTNEAALADRATSSYQSQDMGNYITNFHRQILTSADFAGNVTQL